MTQILLATPGASQIFAWQPTTFFALNVQVVQAGQIWSHNVSGNTAASWAADAANWSLISSGPGEVNAVASDPVGRTEVMGRVDGVAGSAMRDHVSVRDAPWNATGNAVRVTDASMTAGSNQVASSEAGFQASDIGMSCSVYGAGSLGAGIVNPVWGVVWKVTAGIAYLATDVTGTVPVNAVTTVTNATAHFGTDDTAAIIACASAVSANATANGTIGMVLLPPNANFLMHGGANTVFSNVVFWGYGATVLQSAQAKGALFSNGTGITPSTPVTVNVGCYGLKIQGLGQYLGNTNLAGYDRYAPISLYYVNNARVVDCTCDSFSTSGITFSQAQNVRIQRNTVTLSCAAGLNNGIHVTTGNAGTQVTPGILSNDIEISGNTVTGCATACVCLQEISDNTSSPGPQPFNARIHDNYLQTGSNTGASWAGVALEIGGAGSMAGRSIRDVAIHHNHIVNSGTSAVANATHGIFCAQDTGTGNTDQLQLGGIQIDHNRILTTQTGIYFLGSYGQIDHNEVTSTSTNGSYGIQLGASNSLYALGTQVDHNTIVMPANNGVGHGIMAGYNDQLSIENNKVIWPSNATGTGCGIYTTNCFRPSITGNRVMFSPASGVQCYVCTEVKVAANRIYNPSTAGAGAYGINLNGCTSASVTPIHENGVVDDRVTHLMFCGLFVNGLAAACDVRGNRFFGGTNSQEISIGDGGYSFIGSNSTDTAAPLKDVIVVAPAASPWVYQNTFGYPALVGINGGTVSLIQRRRGTHTVTTGATSGEFHLDPNDTLLVTYSVVPTTAYVQPVNQA